MEEKSGVWIFAFIFLILGLLSGFMISGKLSPTVNVDVRVPTTGYSIAIDEPPVMIESIDHHIMLDIAPLYKRTEVGATVEIKSISGNFDFVCFNSEFKNSGQERKYLVAMWKTQASAEDADKAVGPTTSINLISGMTMGELSQQVAASNGPVIIHAAPVEAGDNQITCMGVKGSLNEETIDFINYVIDSGSGMTR